MSLSNARAGPKRDYPWIGQDALRAGAEPTRSTEQHTLSVGCSKSQFQGKGDRIPCRSPNLSEPTEEGIRNELGTEAFPTIRQLIKHPRCTAKPPTRIGNDDAEPC